MNRVDLWSLVVGILIGLVPAALLELSLKPRRDVRNVARILRAEIALNMHLLAIQATYRFKNPKSIPADFMLAHVGYDALTDKIGELKGQLLTDVILLYRRFAYLEEVKDIFGAPYDDREAAPVGSEQRKRIEGHLDTAIEAFNRTLDGTLDHINLVLPRLDRTAYFRLPWRRSGSLKQQELESRVREVANLREDNLRRIRGASGDYNKGE